MSIGSIAFVLILALIGMGTIATIVAIFRDHDDDDWGD